MALTHLIQLQHWQADAHEGATEREVALGAPLAVIERREDSTVVAECTFGVECGSSRHPFDATVDADHLSLAEQAVWQTQRCLVPAIGFRKRAATKAEARRWVTASGKLTYLPALRYSVPDDDGRHGECKLMVREQPPLGPLPLALSDVSPRDWLRLDGEQALSMLCQAWRRL